MNQKNNEKDPGRRSGDRKQAFGGSNLIWSLIAVAVAGLFAASLFSNGQEVRLSYTDLERLIRVAGEEKDVNINSKNLSDFLGVPKYKFGELESENRVGIVTGLAWTEYGGEILKIETVTMPGKGRMQITGKLGDVMQESVKAAKSFVRSKCLEYGIIPPLFEKKDFHIHVPEGATPKDGPSAGIGMVTSIVSSITGIPVRRDVAMTGEVTLTGQVLPIGGLKEKLLAAHRAGIKEVLIPKENEKDLVDMPKKIIDDIKITPVEYADQVLKVALTKELKRTEWVEVDISKKDDKSQASIQ